MIRSHCEGGFLRYYETFNEYGLAQVILIFDPAPSGTSSFTGKAAFASMSTPPRPLLSPTRFMSSLPYLLRLLRTLKHYVPRIPTSDLSHFTSRFTGRDRTGKFLWGGIG